MDANKILEAIQIKTNTHSYVWNKDSHDWLFEELNKNLGICDKKQLHQSIEKTVDELYSCPLPTKYESSLYYPLLYSLLKDLYSNKSIFNGIYGLIDNSSLPVIGTANLHNINAFADAKHGLIVIDRSLCFFLSSIATIIVEFIVTNEKNRFVIHPSKLTHGYIIDKIESNHELSRQFLEIICSYVLFRNTWPYKRYYYGNSEKHVWHELITKEVYRFVIGHELAHILLNDTKSSIDVEQRADYVGAYLCVASVCNDKASKDLDLFWAMAIAIKTLDILYKCDAYFGKNSISHPENRINTIKLVLKEAKADNYAIGMVSIIDMIFENLWLTIKKNVEEITKSWHDGKITSIEELQQVLSIM